MNYVPILISVLALLFTVLSFWWMNWRKGKLHVSEPRTYAAFSSAVDRIVMELPFIFFNDGPVPIIVENLRLAFTTIDGKPLQFNATVKKLGTDESRAFATQFALLGREAKEVICEFQREQGFTFTKSIYPMKLEALLDDKKEWVELCAFSLQVGEKDADAINKLFVVHDNMSEF